MTNRRRAASRGCKPCRLEATPSQPPSAPPPPHPRPLFEDPRDPYAPSRRSIPRTRSRASAPARRNRRRRARTPRPPPRDDGRRAPTRGGDSRARAWVSSHAGAAGFDQPNSASATMWCAISEPRLCLAATVATDARASRGEIRTRRNRGLTSGAGSRPVEELRGEIRGQRRGRVGDAIVVLWTLTWGRRGREGVRRGSARARFARSEARKRARVRRCKYRKYHGASPPESREISNVETAPASVSRWARSATPGGGARGGDGTRAREGARRAEELPARVVRGGGTRRTRARETSGRVVARPRAPAAGSAGNGAVRRVAKDGDDGKSPRELRRGGEPPKRDASGRTGSRDSAS